MKKYLALLILAVCPFIGLKATHFPVLTIKSAKWIEHNDTSIYVLTQEGLEVINKATLTKTVYNIETGYFMEQERVYQLTYPYGGVGQNAFALRPDTIWVGSNNGVLTSISDGIADTTVLFCDLSVEGDYLGGPHMRYVGINSIVFDSKGNMVVGGDNSISVIYPTGEKEHIAFPTMEFGTEVWQMLVDRNDDIWISCTGALSNGNGLMKYHIGGTLEVISERFENNPPFYVYDVRGLALDNDGHLWLGSSHKDGVSDDDAAWRAKLLEYDGNEFTSYDVGPSSDIPISIKCDSEGRIWYLPTMYWKNKPNEGFEYSKGPLCCLDNGEVTRYEWSQDTGYCYCVDIDGDSIYIGTDNGVLVFSDGTFHWLHGDEAGISDASSPQNLKTATFDLQGRRIQGEPKHGVYIRNGKKVMK